ncbi:UNVERIFIED_CONTAM: ATP-dependent zinc metalloprotease FTSH 4, mitochondrial [Sesamum angustifolium]|uniref:ATP-dependent zinc metalloprotease FTSH 4, mitochondrial n=1 Tax=Sesamum angustifolium TaxID=2727405 RepID=A0AAW2K7I5_9LAMI
MAHSPFSGYGLPLDLGFGALIEDKGIGLGLHEEVQPSMELNTKVSDVKGVDEAKAELEEIVHYLRDPKGIKYVDFIAAVLMSWCQASKRRSASWSPATGKTMLARAVAGEAGTGETGWFARHIVVPRGMALGMVSQLPGKDETSISRKQILSLLDISMGERDAEELIFWESEVSSGVSNDLQQATNLARAMVTSMACANRWEWSLTTMMIMVRL